MILLVFSLGDIETVRLHIGVGTGMVQEGDCQGPQVFVVPVVSYL